MGCIYKRGRIYWIKYSRSGRGYYESSGSKKHEDAKRLLRLREGDIERGVAVTPRIGRMRFEEAPMTSERTTRSTSAGPSPTSSGASGSVWSRSFAAGG